MEHNLARVLFHVDMDSFFASIEIHDNPALRGKPVIVGGRAESRSVVSSPSYEARRFGVRSGMAISEARRLCPQAICIPANIQKYVWYSNLLQRVLIEFTQEVEPFSIDESFMQFPLSWERVETIRETGEAIRAEIRSRLGITATIGAAPNKMLAKLCSKAAKPDGMKILPPEEVDGFISALPVGKLWGVGERTQSSLHRQGVYFVRDVRKFDLATLRKRFGAWGETLHVMAWGIDETPLHPYYEKSEAKSLGHEETFERDVGDRKKLLAHLMELSEKVAMRLRKHRYVARSVTVKRKLPDFTVQTRGHVLAWATDLEKDIYEAARGCLFEFPEPDRPVRLIGVTASRLEEKEEQSEGLLIQPMLENETQLTGLMDRMRTKYGESIIHRARSKAGE